MFIVAGIYNWSARLVAFRRDLCASCQCETLALGTRTLDFFHVFWIPVLPLGRWTRWRCAVCGKNPSVATAVRRPFRILLWLFFVLIVLAMLSVAEEISTYDYSSWISRALAGTLVVLTGWWALRPTGSETYQQRRAAVQPYSDDACPLCGAHLVRSLTDNSCSGCAAEHRPLIKETDALVP